MAVVSAFLSAFTPTLLERRADGELERAEFLARPPVQVDAVVDADRPERRLPTEARAARLAEIRQVEVVPEAVDLADVEERRDPEAEGQRHDVLDVPEHFAVAADLHAVLVHGRQLAKLEAPYRVRAAEIVALEERQRVRRPAEAVRPLRARRQDVTEPDRLELRDEDAGLHVA